ncbi:MAG: beta-lactamase family protein [Oscillospiraceae bacterium]|jgi:CubicO group peptidase (beta-lactamase class C family)|nr:beta-lactamase family protein [Oscillospiraceae bacterium]
MTAAEQTRSLPRASYPEEVGVSSQAVLDLINEFERQGMELHSLMVLRHGKVAAECWRHPYAAEIPHAIYSCSKSVAGTAAGFAIDEGLFSMESKLHELFPEIKRRRQRVRYEKITVRHLLNMTAGLTLNVLLPKAGRDDWVGDFLRSRVKHEPGKVFHYANEHAYLISVLIHRLTGQGLQEYLRPRLFAPLGIDPFFWETDAQDREGGGWGICWKTEDSAKFMQCYLDGGKWDGRQVIPAWWVREATSPQAQNPDNCKADSRVGYGYQFWMCREPNTFAARGMFCQQGVVMKDYDAVFVYTGADADEQKPFEVLYPHFPGGFVAQGDRPDPAVLAALREKIAGLTLPPPTASPQRPPLEKELSGETIRLRRQYFLNAVGLPSSLLSMVVNQLCYDKAGGIDDIRLRFGENEGSFSWTEGRQSRKENTLPFGLDGSFREGAFSLSGFDFNALSHARWLDDTTLRLHIRPKESCSSRIYIFHFLGGRRVRIEQRTTPPLESIAENLAALSRQFMNNNKIFHFFARKIFWLAPKLVEAPLRGRRKAK